MKHIYKLISVATAFLLFISCADLDLKSDFLTEKPTDVSEREFLNNFEVLKNYVNTNTYPNFLLGMGIAVNDFTSKEIQYSLALNNFTEITPNNRMDHASTVLGDGTMDFNTLLNVVETAKEAEIPLFGRNLCWHANQNHTYLNGLIADIILPTETKKGVDIVVDFESDNLGDTYPMTGNSTAAVVEDPKGVSGKVLQVGNAETPANHSFPKIEVTLPEGRKLGDYLQVFIDFNGTGSTGLYGQGMRMAINNRPITNYGSPSGFGCEDGNWGRGNIALNIADMNLSDTEKELTTFTLTIGSGTGSGNYYIDNISMSWEITSGSIAGTTVINDFDTNTAGDTYSMMGTGSATVVADPTGKPNQVLNIISNQSFPEFQVSLPANTKLGDCTKITLMFYGTGTTGLYGQGMRLSINGSSLLEFPSPSGNGCVDNQWGAVTLDLRKIVWTREQKALTNFTIAIGSATGSGNYFIDDVTFHWVLESVIKKTPEEKKEILSEALETWIAGVMKAAGGYIKAFDVLNEPMSDNAAFMLRSAANEENPDTNFYWADYLGENYARDVIAMARQHYREHNGEGTPKLFVNEYGLENPDNRKCERLIEMINQWEEDEVTTIDGIGTQMHLVYSQSTVIQAVNEAGIEEMFTLLAATNKLIRISELEISVANENGETVNPSNLSNDEQKAVADYYNYVIRKYFETIPAGKHQGITLWSPVQNTKQVGLWDNGYNRKFTYPGFADGLAGK